MFGNIFGPHSEEFGIKLVRSIVSLGSYHLHTLSLPTNRSSGDGS